MIYGTTAAFLCDGHHALGAAKPRAQRWTGNQQCCWL